jgi:two-component system cell cycle sensor histidine kinase/response regulator CckA
MSEKVADSKRVAAIARLEVENDRLRRRLEGAEKATAQTLARATRLLQVISMLSEESEVDTVLERAATELGELFGADISLLMLGPDTELKVKGQMGLRTEDVPTETFSLSGLEGLTPERPTLLRSVSKMWVPEWLSRYRPVDVAWARLVAGEESLGLMLLGWREPGRLDRSSEKEIRAVAQRIALAITRKRDEEKHGHVAEELAKERHLLNIFLDTTTDGVYFKDSNSRFIRISAALAKHLGLDSPDEAIGKNDFDFFTEEHARPAYEDEQRILRTGEPLVDIEEKETWIDGRVGWVSTTKVPLRDEAGNIIGTYGMSRDITVRKRAQQEHELIEEQLRQSQKMEAIGQLAGGIAHDFNNLLTAIKGYAELAAARAHGEQLSSDIEQILDAARRAADLTRQLLAFSRRQTLLPQPINLNQLIHNFEKLLRRLIGEHIELRTSLTPEAVWIEADASQMEQMIVNLAINARDAMPTGGVLAIELEATPMEATVIVSDTGLGMDEEIRTHAFEPFYTTKEPGEGTGLGLSTVDGIVAQSGGKISLDSTPGVGTTFKITLPRVAPATVSPIPAVPSDRQGRGRVLVVEDEQAVRKVTRRFLENAGFEVLEADGGSEALAILDEEAQIDVMLTDVVMPGISGPELARRAVAEHANLGVVFCSGYPRGSLDAREDLPTWSMLSKPFSSHELVEAICAASERNSACS